MLELEFPIEASTTRSLRVRDLGHGVVTEGIFRGQKGLWIPSLTQGNVKLILLKSLATTQPINRDSSDYPYTIWINIADEELFGFIKAYPNSVLKILA